MMRFMGMCGRGRPYLPLRTALAVGSMIVNVKLKLMGIVIISLLIVSCSEKAREDLKRGFKESYDTGFKNSFRASFMKSCLNNEQSKEKEIICTCVVDSLLKNYSTDELADSEKLKDIITTKVLPECTNEK
jgi:hypothetical protein